MLKGCSPKKWKFTLYLLTTMPVERWVKCLSPHFWSFWGKQHWVNTTLEQNHSGHFEKRDVKDDVFNQIWMAPLGFCGFLHLKTWSPFTSIVFDLAAMLFTPETPKVFCGLKQFTHHLHHSQHTQLTASVISAHNTGISLIKSKKPALVDFHQKSRALRFKPGRGWAKDQLACQQFSNIATKHDWFTSAPPHFL